MARKNKTNKTTQTAQPVSSTFSSSQTFNPDYSYVIKDLKRIGVLASFFFILLVVISLFI